jgi:3',5'-cyclic AMP phosphodiesterase CpdA
MMRDAVAASMRGDDDSIAFPFVRRRGQLAMVGLNTGVPTPPLMATGRLGETQLAKLAHTLAALRAERMFRVVLIHHPPVSETPAHKRLIDAADFLKVIAAEGAELILHGHDHLDQLHWLPGPGGRVPAVGVPSASAAPGTSANAAGYNLYRIEGEPGAWRCEMESRSVGSDGKVIMLKRMVLTA